MSIDVYRCLQMFIDVYRCLQMFIDVYRCLQMIIICLQMFIDVSGCFWMFIDVYRCLQMFIGKCYFEPPTELWSKGLVFLKALRECLHWSFRTADPYMVLAYTQDGYAAPSHTRVLLTRGPYCLSLTTNEQLGFERGSTSSGFNRKKPTSSSCSMVHHSAGI